jgi:arylsulfatase A-like enzyme
MLSFPREEMHPWLFNNKPYLNNVVSMRRYAAEVSGVDDGVGAVLETLERLKLADNTLVVFTGDQGLAGGHSGLWGMGDHTRPLSAFDSTMHVPLVVRHPGVIPAGQRSKRLLSNYNLYPTILDYLGQGKKLPESPDLPGGSLAETLRGRPQEWEETVYFEFENVRAIRTNQWKYIERFKQSPNELYYLVSDPGERRNLIDVPAHASKLAELRERLQAFFARYADPQYNLWRGGRSKADLLSGVF